MHTAKVKGILSAQNGMNLYRGCTHGCIYCDSRSKCYQFTHDFEDVEIKENAIELLEETLKHKRKKVMIATGSMTDPYMPIEGIVHSTRRALEVIEKHGFGATLITKSASVLEDLELLKRINAKTKAVVQMTLTTYDEALCKILEPRVSSTRERFDALKVLRDNGIPTVVWMTPILPYINDTKENIQGILDYCIEAKVVGIICFGMGLTLREGNREYFYEQLDRHFPGLKKKYQDHYGNNYMLPSPLEKELMELFRQTCKQHGILSNPEDVFEYLRTFEDKTQISLFE